MKASDILKKEHRAIEVVLDSLDRASYAVMQGKEVPAWVFEEGFDFIRNFADRCHHGKEEGILLPLYRAKGVPAEGPIHYVLAEHEEARRLVSKAASDYDKWIMGDQSAGQSMAENIQRYISLLRNHIQKEDNMLFPMGDNLITESDDQILVQQFDEIEEQEIGQGVHEEYHKMIERLQKETSRL